MSSRPVGPNSPQKAWLPKLAKRAAPRSAQDARASADGIAQANHDASNQIARAEQAVQDAQNESNVELEHIRDGFDQEQTNQSEKNQEALEKQRLKGYEELRDLKQRQQAEMSRVRREGERNLKQTSDYYRDTLYTDSQKNDQALRDQQIAQAREMKYLNSSGQADLTLRKQDNSRKMEEQQDLQSHRIADLTQSNKTEYERMKNNSQMARQQESAKFQGQYDAVLNQDRQALDHLENKAWDQIREIREDTSQKLAAYSSRQSDPFYKMVDIGAELHDRGDAYVLTAQIPPQEQAHVSATVRGNTLVISGTRRNEEHLTLGPGRTEGTSSFQSYEQSFPLSWPVDRNALTKEFHGDRIIITVPKARSGEFHTMYKAPEPERVRAERPQFPGNLPVPEDLSSDESSGGTGKKPVAGHTLS